MDNHALPQEIVQRRGGTCDLGGKYEAHLAALYAVKCVLDKNVRDFNITSNLEHYGAFDDIILNVCYNDNTKKKYVLQLKHKESKPLSIQMLIGDHGAFSLRKYEDSYKEITRKLEKKENNTLLDTDYIILTNAKFEPKQANAKLKSEPANGEIIAEPKTAELKPDEDFVGQPDSTPPLLEFTEDPSWKTSFLNTLDNSKVWQIKQHGEENNPLYNQDFLEHLYLFTDQVHANDIENMITNLLNIDKEVTKLVLNFFENWVEGKKLKHYILFKKDVEMKLTDIILQMQKISLIDAVSTSTVPNREAYELFDYVIMDYDLTFFLVQEKQKVIEAITWKVRNSDMWVNKEKIFQYDEDKKILMRRKGEHCSVNQIDLDDVYLALWEKGEIPLMIEGSEAKKFESAKDIITKFATVKRKFIIFTNEELNTDFDQYRIFDNLASLHENKMSRVLHGLKISLQERPPVTHKQISNPKLLKLITPHVFMKLTFSKVIFGEPISTSDYTVDRYFKKRMVHVNILREAINSCLIIINREDQHMFLNAFNTYNLIQPAPNVEIQWACVADTSPSVMKQTIKELKGENSLTHFFFWEPHFNYNGIPLLEWIYSNDNSELISRHLVNINAHTPQAKHYFIEANKALEYYLMPITIFGNNSGMGKTVTFRHIAKNCPPHIWVVYIDISTNPKSLKNLDDKDADIITILQSFLSTSKLQTIMDFFCEMFRLKLEDKEVLFLIDSYDFEENQADKLIETLLKTENRVWISTRSCKQKNLEQKRKTVSVQLTGFTRTEAKKAFEAILSKNRFNWDPTETEGILKNISEQLVSIPLLIRMLSRIIMKDGKEAFSSSLTEIDLYERFMETINRQDIFLIMKLALTLFFKEEDLKGVIEWEEFDALRKDMIPRNQRNFILDGFNGTRPQFVHDSYAEYLAAKYLANAHERMQKNRESFKVLIKQLFNLKNINIRIFFDKLLSQTLPLHYAIVNDDIGKVTDMLNENNIVLLQGRDKYGRTPLHLASTYGKFFMFEGYASTIKPFYSDLKGINIFVTDVPDIRHCGENIFSSILKHVYPNIAPLLKDTDILGFNVYDLAYECGCLLNLNVLHSYATESVSYSQNIIFIYHCLQNGLNNILELMLISLSCICHFKCNNEYLLNTTVKHCNTKIIQSVLEKAKDCRYSSQMTCIEIINKYNLLHSACERQDDQMESVISFLFKKFANKYKAVSGAVSPLHVAAEMGNVKCIRILLSNKVSINVTDNKGMTALHRVCIKDHLDCCVELLTHNIKLEKSDNAGNTALHLAIMHSSKRCMTTLLESRANVEAVNKEGYTPLMLAALGAHSECVNELLKWGASVTNSNKKRPAAMLVASDGQHIELPPIIGVSNDRHIISVSDGQHIELPPINLKISQKISMVMHPKENALSQTIQVLLDNGAFINDVDKNGNTALMLAVKHVKLSIADLLLTRGASIQTVNRYGSTALTYAISTQNVAYVNMLIDRNITLQGKDEYGNTNFMVALQTKNEEIINVLLEQENLDICGSNKENETPLILAVQHDLPHLIPTLLARQVPINERDKKGHTALQWSILLRRYFCFDILMQNRASLKGKTITGDTVLLLSIRFGNEEMVTTLLKHKVSLDTISQDGFTALSLSVLKGNSRVVKSLLDAGASVNKANQHGHTALMFAAETGNVNLVKILLEAGADKTKVDYYNQNAYKIAQKKGNSTCYPLLR